MSMVQGKENFETLLGASENRVIALSGRWGTGKSHMWRECQARSSDKAVNGALYVSLFGLRSIVEVKLKAAQAALPVSPGAPWVETIKSIGRAATKVAKGFHSSFSALDEIALLAAPKMLEGRFIVLDDIERKHAQLSIDEVLGFIDDCTQNYKCRILLILNTDQLGEKDIWEKLREKVVDQELRLETTPEEAFEIAAREEKSPFAADIGAAAAKCGIVNIRINRKVIRTVDRILGGREALPEAVKRRVIPSTTLLAAIHYKGIERGPDVAYVLGQQAEALLAQVLSESDDTQPSDEDKETKARWSLLLESLGIQGTDEYEALVARYLHSGQFDKSELSHILDRYCSEENLLAVRMRSKEFFQRSLWRPELTDADIVAGAAQLLPDAAALSPSTITTLHDHLSKLAGGAQVAQAFVMRWVEAFEAKDLDEGEVQSLEDVDSFGQHVHPDIKAAYAKAREALFGPRTLAEVFLEMVETRGWGEREAAALRAASAGDFEQAIRGATGPDLKKLLMKNIEFLTRRSSHEEFGSAMDNFVLACRSICATEPQSRRASILKRVFAEAKLATDLDPDAAAAKAALPAA